MSIYIGVALCRDMKDAAALRQAWAECYLPIVHALPGLVEYDWNITADRFERATDSVFTAMPVLGFSRLTFAEGVSLAQVLASPAGQAMLALEAELLAEHIILEIEERVVVPTPPRHTAGLLKTMSIIRRTEGTSTEDFLHEWRVVHAPMVQAIRQVRGYRQNLILNRWRNWEHPIGLEDFRFDGSVELWYPSAEEMAAAAATPEAQATGAHATRTSSRIEKFQIHDLHQWPASGGTV